MNAHRNATNLNTHLLVLVGLGDGMPTMLLVGQTARHAEMADSKDEQDVSNELSGCGMYTHAEMKLVRVEVNFEVLQKPVMK